MMKTKLLFILLLFASAAEAQYVTDNKRMADVYFQNKEYYAAAEYYKKAVFNPKDSAGFVVPFGFENRIKEGGEKRENYEYCAYQLAESLRLYKNFGAAEGWYEVTKDFVNPKYILSNFWYGETLRSNQKFKEAIAAFNKFLKEYNLNDAYTVKARQEIASCRFALYELSYPRLVRVTNLKNSINTNSFGSNYTPTIKGNNLYFSSSRPLGSDGKKEILTGTNAKVVKKQTPYLNAIYMTSGDPLDLKTTVSKTSIEGKGKETAAPAFHPNGKIAYLTSWTAQGNKKIYQLNAMPGASTGWSEPIELGGQVNVKGFNTMQPFVTKDGKFLIFSSDRPGGLGKYDLWYSPIYSDGTLGTAVNLGNTINTIEDEQAPYYNTAAKKLLYSSNGKIGMGGFDFYESDGGFGDWSEPKNMGHPFNSSKDDLYFTPTKNDDSEGFISSDRESACCLEVFHLKKMPLIITGILLDCNTLKPLKNAVVTLADSVQHFKVNTDEMGKYTFNVNSNHYFKLTADKDKYFSKTLSFSYGQMAQRDTLFSADLCLLPYEIDKAIVLKDILYEFNSADLTPDSKGKLDHLYTIMVDNPTIEIELISHTDSKGVDAYNLDLSNRRAQSCVDYLVEKGIPVKRMTNKGYGETKPIAPNELAKGKDNPEGRALNRRTEFKVTKK
ncbi:OmpA family protein [Pedobacter nyackensis]|uniref:WD40-like Beta Propeller Repeat n=1 Tax=Pedobacter nyackensis TaxID=475255 RepID=A0A1W2C650_9SPHI|nr:OmpA family protein [Pedobacter nyackensis]SMC80679.1 WD40-like Beta Propeller Repeat [Pedobacter nyackensis]